MLNYFEFISHPGKSKRAKDNVTENKFNPVKISGQPLNYSYMYR